MPRDSYTWMILPVAKTNAKEGAIVPRAAKSIRRVLIMGAVCLALITSNVPTAEASSVNAQNPPQGCWLLCW